MRSREFLPQLGYTSLADGTDILSQCLSQSGINGTQKTRPSAMSAPARTFTSSERKEPDMNNPENIEVQQVNKQAFQEEHFSELSEEGLEAITGGGACCSKPPRTDDSPPNRPPSPPRIMLVRNPSGSLMMSPEGNPIAAIPRPLPQRSVSMPNRRVQYRAVRLHSGNRAWAPIAPDN